MRPITGEQDVVPYTLVKMLYTSLSRDDITPAGSSDYTPLRLSGYTTTQPKPALLAVTGVRVW